MPDPIDYTTGAASRQYKQAPNKQVPDEIIHHPPIAMYVIGTLGILAGIIANLFQMFTTFVAFWGILNPNGTPVDLGKQPMDFAICAFIATSFQFSLIVLTFRIDTAWKSKPSVRDTAIQIIQHVNLVTIWGLLGFVVDTVGDYTFVSIYTSRLDAANAIFIVFLYAVALYAFSTVAFVRSIEFLWAGFRASDAIKAQQSHK